MDPGARERPKEFRADLQSDVGARAYVRGFDDRFRGGRDDAASRRLGVDYIEEVTAIGEDQEPALRHGSAADPNCSPRAAATAAADRDRETGPSR